MSRTAPLEEQRGAPPTLAPGSPDGRLDGAAGPGRPAARADRAGSLGNAGIARAARASSTTRPERRSTADEKLDTLRFTPSTLDESPCKLPRNGFRRRYRRTARA